MDLQNGYDSFVERLNYSLRDERELRRLVKKFGSEFFPQPVLPGTGSIVPIQTTEDLFSEGQIMNNCVATYADQLEKGGSTMYSRFPAREMHFACQALCPWKT